MIFEGIKSKDYNGIDISLGGGDKKSVRNIGGEICCKAADLKTEQYSINMALRKRD
jgi:hypothetical protein